MGKAGTSFVDVLIVGAGLSGIGAACHLSQDCPERTFTILESRESLGGTWDLFRYPGIRSDSDMFTLGYEFKPWTEEKSIADGPSILKYLTDTATEYGIDRAIQFNSKVVAASWSSSAQRWRVTVEHVESGEQSLIDCSFLYLNTGYYRYDRGYTPDFVGRETFAGEWVHPQFWPDTFDATDKSIVVIGSGATAVTVVPRLAETAAHVTILQRSPTYIFTSPDRDQSADRLRRLLPEAWAYKIVRARNIARSTVFYQLSRRRPGIVKNLLLKNLAAQLPEGYDVGTHFTPRYNPWDQRVCLDPNGRLLKAISNGSVTMVTDHISSMTETGVALQSGRTLDADVIVCATGLELQMLGGITLAVDGRRIDPGSTVTYRGMMISGVPNLAFTTGYTNASWTLKADLVARYVCRLLNQMRREAMAVVTPALCDEAMEKKSSFALDSGYVQRSQNQIPLQGVKKPWKLHQNYPLDFIDLRFGKLDNSVEFLSKR